MKKKIVIGFLLFLFYPYTWATTTLQVEPEKIQEGEVFKLTITLEGRVANSLPNLNPLEKDFTIIGSQRTLSYSMINGKTEALSQWTILVMPKKTGSITIPPLTVGNESTLSRPVEVTSHSIDAKKFDEIREDIMLLAEVSERKPLVNEQVIYTVRFYNAHPLIKATYNHPTIEEGLLIPIGNGSRHYQSFQNGQHYNVEELQYAIFPQKSGQLKITPPDLQAMIHDGTPKNVHLKAKISSLNVQSIPTHKGTDWLPAKDISLTEHYDNFDPSVKKGATLTRTIQIEANSLPAQLLPKLEFIVNQDFSVYSEPPEEKNRFAQGNIIGTSIIKVNYLFNEAGSFTIPELRLNWFNTKTGKEETSLLPERKIEVRELPSAAATSSSSSKISQATRNVTHDENLQPNQSPEVNLSSRTDFLNKENKLIFLIAIISLFVFMLGLLSIWLWKRKQSLKLKSNPSLNSSGLELDLRTQFNNHRTGHITLKMVYKDLQKVCLENNTFETKRILLQWASLQWPEHHFLNLSDIERRLTAPTLKQQIKKLNEALYSRTSAWEGQALWESIKNFKIENVPTKINNRKTIETLSKMHYL